MSVFNLGEIHKLCEAHPWIKEFYVELMIEESEDVLTKAKAKSIIDNNCIPSKLSDCKIALNILKDERKEDSYGESVYSKELDVVQTKLEHLIVELEDFMKVGYIDTDARHSELVLEETRKTIKGEKRKQVAQRYVGAFTVFVGGKYGIFKGVNVKDKLGLMKNMQNLVPITDRHDCSSKGLRNVKIYDTDSDTLKRRLPATLVKEPSTELPGLLTR